MPAREKRRPTMAEALGPGNRNGISGGLLSFFERAALESGTEQGRTLEVRDLPLASIDQNPRQSRQAFDPNTLEELAASIREHGVIEPIVVRPVGERYEIVAGERRYRAAQIAEQETIPSRIMDLDATQAAVITALENLQREDLDIEDEARQFAYLIDLLDVSQRQLARMLGKDHLYVARRVKLLQRPDLMDAYRQGRIKLHTAVALVDELPDDDGGSQGTTIELVEREDLGGYIVTHHDNKQTYRSRIQNPQYRTRPLLQFYTWVGRTQATDIPANERASVRAQLTEIKEVLERRLEELDRLEDSSPD